MSLQERLETIRSSPDPQNEESAKFQVLAPVLQSLGWDPANPAEVLYEHAVGGKGGGRVDMALQSSGRTLALIEAKAPGSDLQNHIDQVLRYAFHEGVRICVLTTGLEWWLYLPRESGPPQERRFAVLRIADDPVEQLLEDFGTFLSKEALVSGRAEERAKLVLKARLEAAQLNKEIPTIWRGMLSEPDNELVELLSRRVYEKINLRPTKPQAVAALQGSPIPSTAVPADPLTDPVQETATSDSGLFGSVDAPPRETAEREMPRRRPRPTRKPTAIVLWGTRIPVSSHKAILERVADALYQQHRDDFDRLLELKGRKNSFVSRDPRMLGQGAKYQLPESNYFIDTHLSAANIRKRADQFLNCFGYSSSDLEVLFD